MENRKIIVASYIASGMILWFLTRSSLHWLYLTFYQVRRLPGFALATEALPVVVGGVAFAILMTNARVNLVLEEVISELKKVTWPTKDDVVKSTTVVLICIFIASFILGSFDLAWGKVIGYLLHS